MVRGGSRDVVHECRRLGVLDRLYDMLLLTKVVMSTGYPTCFFHSPPALLIQLPLTVGR